MMIADMVNEIRKKDEAHFWLRSKRETAKKRLEGIKESGIKGEKLENAESELEKLEEDLQKADFRTMSELAKSLQLFARGVKMRVTRLGKNIDIIGSNIRTIDIADGPYKNALGKKNCLAVRFITTGEKEIPLYLSDTVEFTKLAENERGLVVSSAI